MFDIMINSTLSAAEPTRVGRCFVSIHADADDLTLLRDAIDTALTGNPSAVDVRSMSGIETRVLVDRLGPALPRN